MFCAGVFGNWNNEQHRHSEIPHVTLSQRHADLGKARLQGRGRPYQTALAQNSVRWSDRTRNWEPAGHI